MGEMKISRFTDSTEISYKKKHAQFLTQPYRKSCMIFATLTGNKSCAILISVKTQIHQELCKPRQLSSKSHQL